MRMIFEFGNSGCEEEIRMRSLYELTMREFSHIIAALVSLAQHSNSQYELKYNLNDLFMRLSRQVKASAAKRRCTCEHLDLRFVDSLSLNELFSPIELSTLLVKLLVVGDEAAVTSATAVNDYENQVVKPWLRVFAEGRGLDLFKSNHLFRERIVDHMLGLIQVTFKIIRRLFLNSSIN